MADETVKETELRLVEQAAQGDRDARRALFEAYRDVAYRVAYRLLRNDADALDVVQDGFIKAFDALASFQRDAAFKTWLLRIVSNRALDLMRSRKVRLAAPLMPGHDTVAAPGGAATGGSRPLERRETAERIEQALAGLPPAQQAVMGLYVGGELTYGQIADIVGVPVGTVMSRIYHARRQLQEMLPDLARYGAGRSES